MAFFGDQPYRDVATVLGVPEGTVKTRIRAGLGRMRAHLAPVPDTASP
jgi:DNA-directed RNA polymerase specialized sigma24 family protein